MSAQACTERTYVVKLIISAHFPPNSGPTHLDMQRGDLFYILVSHILASCAQSLVTICLLESHRPRKIWDDRLHICLYGNEYIVRLLDCTYCAKHTSTSADLKLQMSSKLICSYLFR